MAVASKCRVRAFYAQAYSDEHAVDETLAGTEDFERTEATINNGSGFGLEGECMVTPRLGIPLTLMWLSHDAHVMYDSSTEWLMDDTDIDWFSVTAGLNYHFLEPDNKFDLWAGPFIGLVSFDDAKVTLGNETTTTKFDDPFVWGLQLGLDVPARQGFAFYAGLRWFNLEAEVEGQDIDFNLNPLMWNAGVSYRF